MPPRRLQFRNSLRTHPKLPAVPLPVVLADRGRCPPDHEPLAVNDGEASGVFQTHTRQRVSHVLPEPTRRELRVSVDVGDGRDGVAEHLPSDRAFEELLLRDVQEELEGAIDRKSTRL